MPLYLYYGDEPYLLKRELKQLRETLVDPAMAALSHKVIQKPSLGEVLEHVGTVSFSLGGNTLIEFHEFSPLEKAVSDGDKKLLETLKGLLESVEATKHVLFVNTRVDRKVGFAKWLSGNKSVQVRDFKKLEFWKTDEAAQLIIQDAKRRGIAIAPQAALMLVEGMGTDLQPLMMEVEKLSLYATGRAITVQDVATLSNHNDNTFQMLSDWVNNRQRGEVYKTLDEILLRDHPIRLFGLVQTYLNNAYRLKLWQQLGIPEAAMAERTKKHPFKVKKDLQEFAAVPLQRLAMLKEKAVDLEWKYKTGQLPDRLALDILIGA